MDETCKNYILQYCGNLFISYRNKVKAKYYDPYNTYKEILRHKPPHLSDDEWRWLINFWGTPAAKVNIMIFFFFSYSVSFHTHLQIRSYLLTISNLILHL